MFSTVVILCDILGFLCILLNLFIITIIIKHRKRILRNVFYIMVFHCSIVDLLRGCCLIIWGLPHIVIGNHTSIHDRLLVLKINQFTIVILRSCNLLTIFNLLIFTCNEYIVIRYPLLYRRHFKRQIVLISLLLSWLISLILGIGSLFSNFFQSAHSVVVVREDNDIFAHNSTFNATFNSHHKVTRRASVMIVNMLSMLLTFFLCYLSLFIVMLCYVSIMCTIRRIRNEVFLNSDSSSSVQSKRIISSNRLRVDKLESQPSNITNNKQRRHWKTHLMSRHKYLIVIGTILFVYILFLFPYSGMQLLAFLHLSNILVSPFRSAVIRWSLQILIGMHAVCQPLCYFRMVEFRRLACHKRKTKVQQNFYSRDPNKSGEQKLSC